jgi:uncharacterized membrane protein
MLRHKLILLIVAIYTVVITTVVLNRFWQYEAFYYDHGMMESTAYQVSRFQMPLHDREYGRVSIYVDHLYPSLQLFLAPFYWLWNSYETPLVVMCLTIGLSVLVAYDIGRKLIKSRLMVYALLVAYMLFIGMQNALIFMVHDITLEILFLMLLFWAVVNKKIKTYYLLLLINLGFKESVAVTTLAIGLFLLVFNRQWRKHGLVTIAISIVYGWLATKLIIPYFQYQAFGKWGTFRYTPQLTFNPIELVKRFIDMPQKRETIFVSLSTFGFLPLFSPTSWILVLQDFAQRFVLFDYDNTFRTGLTLHYNANLVVLLFFTSVLGVAGLQKFSWYRKVIAFHALGIIVLTLIYHRFTFHGPLGLFYNPEFYRITAKQGYMNDFVAKVPRVGKIMVQNNLAVRFTHENLYLLLGDEHIRQVDPDVIVLDFHPGQNISNFWPNSEEAMVKMSKQLLSDPRYLTYYQEDYRYIFVKK